MMILKRCYIVGKVIELGILTTYIPSLLSCKFEMFSNWSSPMFTSKLDQTGLDVNIR